MNSPAKVVKKGNSGWLRTGVVATIAALVSVGVLAGAVGRHSGFRALVLGSEENAEKEHVSNVEPPSFATITCLGRMEPSSRVIRVACPSGSDGAKVEHLLVEEGDQVSAGQLIATLDVTERREAAVTEALSKIEVAKARLAQIQAGAKPGSISAQAAKIAKDESVLALSENEYKRVKELKEKGATTLSDFDRRQMEYDSAKRALAQSQFEMEALKEVRAVDVALAESEIQRAEAELTRARAELSATQLKAPISGTVLKVHTRSGEKAGDKGVVDLGDVSRMHVVAEVFETEIPRVRLGQQAVVRLPSWRREFVGEVKTIGSMIGRKVVLDNDPVSDTDARVVEVRIALDEASSAVVSKLTNMTVEIDIRVGVAENQTTSDSSVSAIRMNSRIAN